MKTISLSILIIVCAFTASLHGATVSNINLGYDPSTPSPDHDLLVTYTESFDPAVESGVKVVFDWRRWGQSIARLNMPFEQSDDNPTFRTKDYSTNGSHGTVHGAFWNSLFGTYDGGGYFDLDGVNDYISVSPFPNLNQFTLETRIKADALVGYNALISKGINPRPVSLWLTSNKVEVWWGTGLGASKITSVKSLVTGFWYHIAATYDGANLKLYIDGTLDSSVPLSETPPSNPQPLVFGQRGDNTFFFDGKIDEVRIYTFALSADQIAEFANGGPDNRLKAAETEMTEVWSVRLTPNGRVDNQSYKDGPSIQPGGITINTPECDFLLSGCNSSWQSNRRYCLAQDITNDAGSCMEIPANKVNVTLHCNGYNPDFDLIDGDNIGPSSDHGVTIGDLNGGPNGITITGCTIREFAGGILLQGTQLNPVDNPTISNNDILLNANFGILALGYSNNGLVSDNWLRWNGAVSDYYDTGVAEVILRKDNSNWVITGNLFDGGSVNSNRSGLYLGSYLGVNPNVVVNFNRFANYNETGSAGIEFGFNDGAQVYNNVFQGNTFGVLLHYASGNTFWNNDFKFSSTAHVHRHPSAINNVFTVTGLGNYWDDFDTPAEGCHDLSPTDGVCDASYDTGIKYGDPDPIVDVAPKTTPLNP